MLRTHKNTESLDSWKLWFTASRWVTSFACFFFNLKWMMLARRISNQYFSVSFEKLHYRNTLVWQQTSKSFFGNVAFGPWILEIFLCLLWSFGRSLLWDMPKSATFLFHPSIQRLRKPVNYSRRLSFIPWTLLCLKLMDSSFKVKRRCRLFGLILMLLFSSLASHVPNLPLFACFYMSKASIMASIWRIKFT